MTVDMMVQIPGNMVARYGSEEFAIILPETTLMNAYQVAEEIRSPIETLKTKRVVTASVGVTCIVPKSNLSIADFITRADYGLFQSKHQGRNRVSIYPYNELLSTQKQ